MNQHSIAILPPVTIQIHHNQFESGSISSLLLAPVRDGQWSVSVGQVLCAIGPHPAMLALLCRAGRDWIAALNQPVL